MTGIPYGLVKDSLSTGCFFEEVKVYAHSKEIDPSSFSRDFAGPDLIKKSELYQETGQSSGFRIAIMHLYFANRSGMNDCR